jgi:hypothetical protein
MKRRSKSVRPHKRYIKKNPKESFPSPIFIFLIQPPKEMDIMWEEMEPNERSL